MLKILITGANGQLGSTFRKLSNNLQEIEFIFTDVEEMDITEKKQIDQFLQTYHPSYIINCAGYTAVDLAEDEPEKAYALNNTAVQCLSNSAKQYGAKLIHISTDYVFGGEKNTPYKEEDETNALSVYGKSKASGEEKIKDEDHVMVIRTSWLYSNFHKNFYKTIQKLSSEREKLNVVYDQIGTPTFAGDLASVIITILEHNERTKSFQNGIFHYSNEGIASWYDFAIEIINLSGNHCIVHPVESHEFEQKAKRPFYSLMSKRKIRNSFHIEIPYWKESLKKCLNEID